MNWGFGFGYYVDVFKDLVFFLEKVVVNEEGKGGIVKLVFKDGEVE